MGRKAATENAEDQEDDGLASLSLLAQNAGKLPARILSCAFHPESRVWAYVRMVEKADRGSLLHGFTHQVEKSRSSQATCKFCGEKIMKDSLRIGYPTKDHRGDYGAVQCWLHVGCARKGDKAVVALAKGGDAALTKRLYGYESLSEEERVLLCDDLLRPASADDEDPTKLLPPAESAPKQLPQAPAPAQLTVALLPFQAEGLHWLLEREADLDTRGGVLADEMGMGKTLQTISLILANQASGPTLVVCPAAAMLQWRNEILRFVETGSLEVEIYYGFDRKKLDFDGKANTIVLTTYQTLEADFRVEVNQHKVPCKWCQRLFLPEKLKYHQKYFCGPDAQRTEKQSKQDRNLSTEMKDTAVKKMKIGGMETDIVLNPLNAIRGASTSAARRLARKTSETKDISEVMEQQGASSSSATSSAAPPPYCPFPVGVLPEEARANLGFGLSANGAGSPSAKGRGKGGRGRGCKRRKADETSETVAEGNVTESARTTPAKKLKFKCKFKLSGQTPVKANEPSSSAPMLPPSGVAFGKFTLKKTPEHKAIDLDESDNSDLELMGEVDTTSGTVLCGSGKADESSGNASGIDQTDAASALQREVVDKSSGSNSSPAKDTVRVCKEYKPASNSCTDMATSLPPRPDSEDDDDRGVLDLSKSPLFRTRWGRIVLDEAHRIKGRTNSTAQAAFALHARKRWCLSGTPIQNRVGELYSLVRFLRFHPFAHYVCKKKGCNCTSLHYRFDPETSRCDKCGCTKMQHRSYFASTISNPIMKFGFIGAGRAAMETLRTEVVDRIILRRTKAERQADINLPPLEIKIRRDALSPDEQDFYKSMYTASLTKFDTYVDRGTLLHNYAHVFDLIMRLRQAVDHPYLIVHGSLKTAESIPTASRGNVDVCALCQDDVDDPANRVVAACGHSFHRDCVSEYLEEAPELPSGGIGCPTCFAPLTVNLEEADVEEGESIEVPQTFTKKSSIMQRIKSSEFKSSTKIEALMQELKTMIAKDSGSKALVFSQFTSFLEIIEWRMKREGISSAKLTGSISIQARSNMIISFQTDPSLKVLLISLKAGGEGLNLQAADHIFVMDPWWNPAAELQAIQRAHRIGQTRPVYATRLVASDTIEDKIIELQQKKQSVFDCTIGNSNQALARLTSEDIQFLFQQ
jgi:DNA repair protein RAD16